MENKNAFLGTGWQFPVTFNKKGNRVEMSSYEKDIKESLHILLTTKLGERVMLPDYGCNIEDLLFETLDRTLITFIVEEIKTAILYHEPRIDVLKIDIQEADLLEGKLEITIDYIVRVTNSRINVVFPFYKEEGTDI